MRVTGLDDVDRAIVSKVVDIAEATALDGMAVLNPLGGLLIAGDPITGELYTIDVNRGTVAQTAFDQLLNRTAASSVGVNGLKSFGNNLYFTNSAQGVLGQLPVEINTGKTIGPASVIYNASTLLDDFIFDRLGNTLLTLSEMGVSELSAPVEQSGPRKPIQSVTSMSGPTACRFGATLQDAGVLYVTFTPDELDFPMETEASPDVKLLLSPHARGVRMPCVILAKGKATSPRRCSLVTTSDEASGCWICSSFNDVQMPCTWYLSPEQFCQYATNSMDYDKEPEANGGTVELPWLHQEKGDLT